MRVLGKRDCWTADPMSKLGITCALTMMIILAISLSPPAFGADYSVLLDGDHLRVSWTIHAWQNLTAFQDFPTTTTIFPQNISRSLTGADLSAFSTSLQKTIHAKVSTVTVTGAAVNINSNKANYSCIPGSPCPIQWLNVTAIFEIRDTPPAAGGVARYDLSWKAVRLNDDLQAGGVSFNNIGERYLIQGLVPFVTFPAGPGRGVTVTVGKQPVVNSTYQAPTGQIVMFDMSALQTPLENWNYTRDFSAGMQTWTTPQTGGFSVLAVLRITEADTILRLPYYATAHVSAQVSAPLNAFARGDILYVDTSGSLWEKVAFATIVGSLGVWIGATIVERRIIGASWPRRRGRKH